jgi:hypothetical protein
VRRLILVLGVAACGSDPAAVPEPRTFEFGPYTLAPGQEITNQCVSSTLHNDEPLYISAVELTTGPGFHHSNWFWVPDSMFDGDDGTWPCATRGYDESIAGLNGGVVFAQSTQATHEVQQFPAGVGIVIPPHSRIVAGTHLLNPGDEMLSLTVALKITPIAEPTTILSGLAFTNTSISIPPHRISRMTQECDVGTPHQAVLSRPMDFNFYYAVAHYHALGRGMTIEATKTDGTTETIFTTEGRVGDALGGTLEPAISTAGYSKIKYWCEFDNQRDTTVTYGVGDREMCTFLTFTDSEKSWTGGALQSKAPTIVDHGDYIEYTYPCDVFSAEPNR